MSSGNVGLDDLFRRLGETESRHDQRASELSDRERLAAWVENFPVVTRWVRVGGTDDEPVEEMVFDAAATLRAVADAIRRGENP